MQFFGLDDDERVITETAAAFAAKRVAPYALEWDAAQHFPVDVLREAAQLGMAAIYCRDDVGGSALRRLDGVRIFEQLAIACPTIAAFLSIHNMCAWMIDTFGTDEQRKAWVPRLASMEVIASYCLTEPGAGSDAGALRTRAVQEGGDYVLDGVKQFISGAGASDVYVVMARTGADGPRGISAFIVEKGTPGLSFGAHEEKMGWNAQPTAQVVLDGVRVPAEAMLGGVDGEGGGFGIAMNGLNGGRINIAACSLGGAQAAFDKAASYLLQREAFGSVLLDEPTIRFTLADMATALESSRMLLWRAATALDSDAADKVELCAMAKLYVTDACFDVADQALQLHGGYGYLLRVRSGEDRARSAGAPHPGGNQRDHAGGHRSSRGRPGRAPARRKAKSTCLRLHFWGWATWVGRCRRIWSPPVTRCRDSTPFPRPPRPPPTTVSWCQTMLPAAVAGADVVITMLPHGDAVKRCYAEILPAASQGALFIDSSTISVDDAREVHALAASHGLAQLDAPVSGGVKGAVAGTLAFMVGGDDTALELARPVLEPMAGKIIHCGASGAGQAAKVCNNMVLAVQQIAIGEAFVLAEKLGLSAQSLFDVITGATGNCWAVHTNCPVPGPGADLAGQPRLHAGLCDRADEQRPRAGDGCRRLNRFRGAVGQSRRRHLCEIRNDQRRQGLQRRH